MVIWRATSWPVQHASSRIFPGTPKPGRPRRTNCVKQSQFPCAGATVRPLQEGRIVLNKANLPRTDLEGGWRPRRRVLPPLGTSAPNKPNLLRASGEANTLQQKSYGELDIQRTPVKQSQCPCAGATARPLQEGGIVRNKPNLLWP
jgi:hypothetical protein